MILITIPHIQITLNLQSTTQMEKKLISLIVLIQTYQYLILYILIEDQLTSHLVNKCKMILLTFSTHKTNSSTICYRYSSDGKDILIQDRREYIYGNTSLCESGCIYKSINYTSNTVNCECNFNFSSDKIPSLHRRIPINS